MFCIRRGLHESAYVVYAPRTRDSLTRHVVKKQVGSVRFRSAATFEVLLRNVSSSSSFCLFPANTTAPHYRKLVPLALQLPPVTVRKKRKKTVDFRSQLSASVELPQRTVGSIASPEGGVCRSLPDQVSENADHIASCKKRSSLPVRKRLGSQQIVRNTQGILSSFTPCA